MKDDTIAIGEKRIGATHPPLLIAEMSGNHRGSLNRALEIVRAAAKSGADAIKLQTFTASTLTIDSARPEFFIDDPASLWHGRRLWELYEEAHTPWSWHEPIFELARSLKLACISTAFDESSLAFLLTLGVDAIKIASFELVHIPLIRAVSKVNKPALISTGMATLSEMDDAVAAFGDENRKRLVLLKCTSAYPSLEDDANLVVMEDTASRYKCLVGISDHTLRPFVAYAAVAMGASVVEKHLTLCRADGGVDAAFSLEPSEFRDLADGTRLIWQSRGERSYRTRKIEDTSRKERPSIYVVKPIKKGEALTKNNIRVIRPSGGLPPKYFESVLGRPVSETVDRGAPLDWGMIEGGSPDNTGRGGDRHEGNQA
jgi:N-acetylneuraminate synthase